MLYRMTHAVVHGLVQVAWRPDVEGAENIPLEGPVILASNHLSFIDSVVIPVVSPRKVAFLAKAEYFEGTGPRGWVSRKFFSSLGSVPVRRDGHRESVSVLESALAVLDEGRAFGIYPEGTRSRDGRLYRGRTGVGWLALTSGAPVVPVGLCGTQHVQPVGNRLPRVHTFSVRIGKPLDLAECGEAADPRARRAATDRVMAAIAELTGQEVVPTYNLRPPEA